MSEFKPTPGEWTYNGLLEVGPMTPGSTSFYGSINPVCKANTPSDAKLIADAGNTYNATGMTPSQLAERVNVLEDALWSYSQIMEKSCDYPDTSGDQIALGDNVREIRKLLIK